MTHEWIDLVAEEARIVALSMVREKGRGAVLVGAARVDAALEALLKAALAPPQGSETLFPTDRPLRSFGAKIALAARLSLIEPAVEQSPHNLRRVHNAFAHSPLLLSLSDPPYQERLRACVNDASSNPLWGAMQSIVEKHLHGELQPEDIALRDYILLITILVAFLEVAAQQLTPLKPSVVMGFGGLIARSD